jgi:hypothetical protein
MVFVHPLEVMLLVLAVMAGAGGGGRYECMQ